MLGVQILMGGVIRTSIQPNMTRLIEDVHDGKLDYALTKPEDAQMLVSVREVRSGRSSTSSRGCGRRRDRYLADLDGRRLGRCGAFVLALVLGAVLSTASGSSSRPLPSGS